MGLDGRGIGYWQRQNFNLLHSFLAGFGAHHASYPMGTGGSFPWGKAARNFYSEEVDFMSFPTHYFVSLFRFTDNVSVRLSSLC
jgi:hypothetical protein